MHIFIIILSLASNFAFSQDVYFEDTYVPAITESIEKSGDCQNKFAKYKDKDIKNLFKALIQIKKSKNCQGIKSFGVVSEGSTRGQECPVKPSGEMTGISFGSIDINMIDATAKKLKWDTAHIDSMSVNDYLYEGTQGATPFLKQLKDLGICKNLKDEPRPIFKDCSAFELQLKSFGSNTKSDDLLVANVKIAYKAGNKTCDLNISDDDGVMALSLVMLQVKQRAQEDLTNSVVEFKPEETKLIREAIQRNNEINKINILSDEIAAKNMVGENTKLNSLFKNILEKNSKKMSKQEFSDILKYVGSRVNTVYVDDPVDPDELWEVDHFYSRVSDCGNGESEDTKKISQLVYGGLDSAENIWDLNDKREGECSITVLPADRLATDGKTKTNGSKVIQDKKDK